MLSDYDVVVLEGDEETQHITVSGSLMTIASMIDSGKFEVASEGWYSLNALGNITIILNNKQIK